MKKEEKLFLILDKEELDNSKFKYLVFTIGHISVDISEISSGKRRKVLGSIPGR